MNLKQKNTELSTVKLNISLLLSNRQSTGPCELDMDYKNLTVVTGTDWNIRLEGNCLSTYHGQPTCKVSSCS